MKSIIATLTLSLGLLASPGSPADSQTVTKQVKSDTANTLLNSSKELRMSQIQQYNNGDIKTQQRILQQWTQEDARIPEQKEAKILLLPVTYNYPFKGSFQMTPEIQVGIEGRIVGYMKDSHITINHEPAYICEVPGDHSLKGDGNILVGKYLPIKMPQGYSMVTIKGKSKPELLAIIQQLQKFFKENTSIKFKGMQTLVDTVNEQ